MQKNSSYAEPQIQAACCQATFSMPHMEYSVWDTTVVSTGKIGSTNRQLISPTSSFRVPGAGGLHSQQTKCLVGRWFDEMGCRAARRRRVLKMFIDPQQMSGLEGGGWRSK